MLDLDFALFFIKRKLINNFKLILKKNYKTSSNSIALVKLIENIE